MPPSDDRISRYHARRQERLRRLPTLRSAPTTGRARAWYVAGELLVLDEERRAVERYLSENRGTLTATGDEEVTPGLRRYRAAGLDVPDLVRTVHGRLPAGADVVAANHVLLSAPFNHGGPFGPPQPAAAATLAAPAGESPVHVAIVDTGLWPASRLPQGYLTADVDVETATDVDSDGVLDGDVGHANFIAGVIAAHTGRVRLSVHRVLDTFGLCTELQLIEALDALDASVSVVNLSLGGYTPGNRPPIGLRVALENALSVPDRVVVAAAGNDGNAADPFWPAAFARSGPGWADRIAAVAAHDGTRVCGWSNTGAWVTVAARGEDVHSTFIDHDAFPSGWALWSGTSFATPRVVAEVATGMAAGLSAPAALDRVTADAAATIGGYPVAGS
ncbi:hypothetical protein J2S43_003655 [Catenuloplanes nepalensis]|uniref:Peptidase S8/S53 domain-containing protein n=1 Tax=Catenuloplanes nepalensis TaxID=587533 RepID=A0ABT9MUL2_9ACTN|nr:S8/S53 family peptidase [Catenuloplanes nepalensis]MDP9795143.1 hypothetical protein [Catenuloplanes nepalensis]